MSTYLQTNNNFDIIYLSAGSLKDKLKINTHRVGLHLARKARVLYVQTPTNSLFGFFKSFNFKELWFNIRGIKVCSENLVLYNPFAILPIFLQVGILKRLEALLFNFFTIARIRHFIKKYRFANPILWLYSVELHHNYIGKFNEAMVVYDCVDDLVAFPRFNTAEQKRRIEELELQVLRKSSVVFAISKHLADKKKDINPNTYYVPNVADFGLFNQATQANRHIPKEMTNIPKPILGYVGALASYRIDFNLINYVADKHPEWSIVLIGPIETMTDDNRLLTKHNIYCLGLKEYHTLPSYIKGFDICILPYIKNEYTHHNFPLKFWEFVATGKPIVASDISALREFADLIHVCATRDEFIGAVNHVLNRRESDATIEKRLNAARINTWEKRIDKMLIYITTYNNLSIDCPK